jgi:hypothetical protein
VDHKEDLADLFRQFDSRKSGRTPGDVAGAFQGLHDELRDVPRPSAKLAVEGVAWYDRHIEGLPSATGDDIYTLFAKEALYPFIRWIGDVFSVKTPELRRVPIVAAMYGTTLANEEESRKFWREVSRGGVEYEDQHPATVLDAFLKAIIEEPRRKLEMKPGNFYQAAIYAWNAYREDKTISNVKYDTKKGLYAVAA